MTEKKLAANRRNALASTGPTSPEGKARVSRNAVRHGLLARDTLLPSEDGEAFDAFRSRLVSTLAPVGDVEALLVDRIVGLAWRLGRLTRIEAGLLTPTPENEALQILTRHADPFSDMKAAQRTAGVRLAEQFRGEREELTSLSHLETVLERGFFKALHELERLQRVRGGALVPPPLALDVTTDGPVLDG